MRREVAQRLASRRREAARGAVGRNEYKRSADAGLRRAADVLVFTPSSLAVVLYFGGRSPRHHIGSVDRPIMILNLPIYLFYGEMSR